MSSNNNTKLLFTAAGAAIGGAAVSFAALKYFEQKKEIAVHKETLGRNYRRTPSYMELSAGEEPDARSSSLLPHNHEERMRRRIANRVAVEEDNSTPRSSVTVRVPATSANMGPGCKLSFYNKIQ